VATNLAKVGSLAAGIKSHTTSARMSGWLRMLYKVIAYRSGIYRDFKWAAYRESGRRSGREAKEGTKE
jgi:hypothetical protein